jgi:hypothetical protein
LRTPRVAISIDGVVTPYDAEPVRAPDGHARIRAALREKYGFRDAWAGLVVDTKHSVAVCLRAPGALARAPYPD